MPFYHLFARSTNNSGKHTTCTHVHYAIAFSGHAATDFEPQGLLVIQQQMILLVSRVLNSI